jgi:hypothetical protein
MTQAVNLANFANNLDSSGGVSPSALNAAVPIAKGGTNSTTTSAARTALGLDYVTIGQLIYPVGSIYINANETTNPSTLLGFGTWVAFGSGRVPVGLNAGDPLFDVLEETGGSKDAVVISHTHSASTAGAGTHAHTIRTSLGTSRDGGFGAVTTDANQFGTTMVSGNTDTIPNHTHDVTVDAIGSSGTNANLQPYITVAMWKRTA